MSIRLKYLSALKKITGAVLAHYSNFGVLAVVGYYVIFGLLAMGTPAVAFNVGEALFGTNNRVSGIVMLALLFLVTIPILPFLLILLFLINERMLMFFRVYWLFGIEDYSMRNAIHRWRESNAR